jgi:hypothetical protein
MGRLSRRGVLAGLGLGLTFTSLGCGIANPFLIPYMFSGGRTKAPAEFKLAVHPKKADAKVVVRASARMGLPPDLAGVDRMLNAELIRILDAAVKENDEKVQVLKMPRIDEYRAENPNWKVMHPCEFGRAVAEGTDYVIDVEINEMDLYKPRSQRQWLLGHANVSVCAYDLSKPLREPSYRQEFVIQYPQSEQPVESPGQVSAFRLKFIERIASDIAVKFTDSEPKRRVD